MRSITASNEPIHALTSLRFIAALWVVLHHYGESLVPFDAGRLLLERGATGVSFFFVLSGFILAVNYPVERLRWFDFLKARFARVYPVYLLGLAISLPLFFLGEIYNRSLSDSIMETIRQTLACVFLVQAWIPDRATLLNPPSWSLSAEMFFYISFIPLIGWKATRVFIDKHRLAIPTVWIAGIAITATWMAMHPGLLPSPDLVGEDAWNANFHAFHPVLRIPEFILGVALGRWHLAGNRMTARRTTMVVAAVVSFSALLFTPDKGGPFLHNALLALPFGLIILGIAQGGSRSGSVFSHQKFVLLGEASYALYILHVPIHEWMRILSHKAGIEQAWREGPVWNLLYLAVVVAISILVFQRFENPARKWIRSLGKGKG